MAISATSVTTNEVRLTFTNLFTPQVRPGGKPEEAKYSTTILVPKTDHACKAALDTAIKAAIDLGVGKCWNGVRPPQPSICVHDGDGPRPSDGQAFGEECRGCWVFTASSKNAPFVVDRNVQPILQQSEIYSGVYGRVSVNFFPYNSNGKKGVGCGLNGVQKLRDGEALAGRVSAEEAFGAASAPAYPQAPVYNTAPAYPQAPAYTAPAYPQAPAPVYHAPAAAPVGYTVNPLTGEYIPAAAPIMGL